MKSVRIKNITKVNGPKKLIDIETTGNHLFFANGVLTHNSAVGASQHDHSHIAGGISKINESDVYWSIVMTESMRAQGQIAFTLQKTRNSDGVGNTIYLKWDNKHLRIRNPEDKTGLTFKKKESNILGDDDKSSESSQDLASLLTSLH